MKRTKTKRLVRLLDDHETTIFVDPNEVAAMMPSPRPGSVHSVITLRCGSAILLSGTVRQNATALGLQLAL